MLPLVPIFSKYARNTSLRRKTNDDEFISSDLPTAQRSTTLLCQSPRKGDRDPNRTSSSYDEASLARYSNDETLRPRKPERDSISICRPIQLNLLPAPGTLTSDDLAKGILRTLSVEVTEEGVETNMTMGSWTSVVGGKAGVGWTRVL